MKATISAAWLLASSLGAPADADEPVLVQDQAIAFEQDDHKLVCRQSTGTERRPTA
jgi:hypothetical protein